MAIQAGTFQMGSPVNEPCREPGTAKETLHSVTLTHNFELQTTEVTQRQFLSVMGYNPSKFTACGGGCPVENLTWYEAAAYANALSQKAGLKACYTCTGSGSKVSCAESTAYSGGKIYTCPGYRLPTEAEWEFAHRAGTSTAYYSGINNGTLCKHGGSVDTNADLIGWYVYNAGVSYTGCYPPQCSGCPACVGTMAVGQKKPNNHGLYDMTGNVWEWCHDGYIQDLGSSTVTNPAGSVSASRMMRGGSWLNYAQNLRAAERHPEGPANHFNTSGFRPARSLN